MKKHKDSFKKYRIPGRESDVTNPVMRARVEFFKDGGHKINPESCDSTDLLKFIRLVYNLADTKDKFFKHVNWDKVRKDAADLLNKYEK